MSTWLTPREAGEILGVTRLTVCDLVRCGDLPARHLARNGRDRGAPVCPRIVIPRAAVERRRVAIERERERVRVALDQARSLLVEGRGTNEEIAHATGLHRSTVTRMRREMHEAK